MPEQLDRTFSALADPTRRALLAHLDEKQQLSVSELAEPLAMSLPAVMKHLGVLEKAGLIRREKIGRSVTCEISPEPMAEAMGWLNHYARYWNEKLDNLTAFLEQDTCQPTPKPSKGASKRARKLSSPPGRNPRK